MLKSVTLFQKGLQGINVLSLDAPIVALVWQHFWGDLTFLPIPHSDRVALGLSVWIIYSLDRWLDNSSESIPCLLAKRHTFVKANLRIYFPILVGVTFVLLVDVFVFMSHRTFIGGTGLGLCCVLYLAAFHIQPIRNRIHAFKEAAIALLFSAGTMLSVGVRLRDVTLTVGLIYFALAWCCFLNCWGISVWESKRLHTHSTYSLLHRFPTLIHRYRTITLSTALVFALAAIAPELDHPLRGAAFCLSLTSVGLFILDQIHSTMDLDATRVLADFALLTPLLLIPLAVP